MKIQLNYSEEIEEDIHREITFIEEEFALLFNKHTPFTTQDRKIAIDLLKYLSRFIDVPFCTNYLFETLASLEKRYPSLF